MKKILVIDVGGTNIKVSLGSQKEPLKIPSGENMTAARMAAEVKKAIAGSKYDAVSIGYPGPVIRGRPRQEPANLGAGWVRFDYQRAFGKPVRVINDAAMQALGSYQGGRMLFLGLGTGLGSALVANGTLEPLELAHLPYRDNRTYEDFVGLRGMKRLGKKKWRKHVARVVALLKFGLQVDYVMLGGGQTKYLKELPPGVRLGTNAHAAQGGVRIWEELEPRHPRRLAPRSRSGRKPRPVAIPVAAEGVAEPPSAS
jgi:polyphosphate glucokinase